MSTNFVALGRVPERRRGGIAAVVLAALTALGLVLFMVASVTGAAWTATTRNDANAWDTATVTLTDSQSGTAMFAAADMLPGTTVTASITVTNAGSVPLDVSLYGANFAEENGLGAHLDVTIGTTSGASDVYAGTLANFATSHTGYASGTAAISLASTGTQTYYFSVQLAADAPDSVQGSGADIDFVWEGHTQ